MLLAGAILAAIFWLPAPWGVVAVVSAAVVELAEVALWVWWSRRGRPAVGAEAFVGRTGAVVSAGPTVASVRVDGELWRARSDAPVEAGDRVVVVAVEAGLTLHVRPFRADG